jgi:hypothetical protein
MLLQRCFKAAQFALFACFGFYLLVVFIVFLRAGDPAALLWASGLSLAGIVVTFALCAALWFGILLQRRRGRALF